MKLRTALAAILVLAPAAAYADTPPTVWDLGKNPDAFAQRRQHLAMERDIDLADELGGDSQIVARVQMMHAEDEARMLDESYRGPRDYWLRFDEAWLAMRRHEYARALPILEQLAKEKPTTFFSEEIWQKLAECYVRLERTKDEIHSYDEVLKRATTDGERLTPLLNQGEAYMRAGDIDTAVAQFRTLLPMAARENNVDISLLAQWDLAVALDRSGDFRTALDTALAAVRTTKISVLMISPANTNVYFVPEYERDWYQALAQAALALDGGTPREVADHWRAAEESMVTYVESAARHGNDRWLPLARQRVEALKKRRIEAEKRAPPREQDQINIF